MSPGSTCDPDLPPLIELKGLRYPQKLPICRYLSPLPDSNRRPPPYHAIQTTTGGSRWQRFGASSSHFPSLRRVEPLPPVAPPLFHNCSIPIGPKRAV
jgi:hypothetical protein